MSRQICVRGAVVHAIGSLSLNIRYKNMFIELKVEQMQSNVWEYDLKMVKYAVFTNT